MSLPVPTPRGLSRGYLPVTALRDLHPTAVGKVDLGGSIHPTSPDGEPLVADCRDCLLLIRLHDDPLAVIHLEGNPTAMEPGELAAAIWRLSATEIRRHVQRCECGPVPEEVADLLHGPGGGSECPGSRLPEAPGSAAVILSTIGQELGQLERCLRSLLGQRRGDLEVVVVDNRPAAPEIRAAVDRVAEGDPRVRYVAESRPGLSVARNRGLVETDAEFVAFTDDDVVVDPLWLGWLVAPFADSRVAATCGMVLPLALETEAQKRFEHFLGFSRGVHRRVHDLRTGRDARIPFYPFLADVFGSGNSMAFRRAELLRKGGFDPALGAGSPACAGEETDAFSREILAGRQIVYEPRALSWHEHRRDGESLRGQIFGYGVGVGALVTKALISDPRFFRAAAAQLRPAIGGRADPAPRSSGRPPAAGAEDLLRARRAGIVRGPWRYARGVALSRKRGLRRMKAAGDPNA